jgi:hypothetical protein
MNDQDANKIKKHMEKLHKKEQILWEKHMQRGDNGGLMRTIEQLKNKRMQLRNKLLQMHKKSKNDSYKPSSRRKHRHTSFCTIV